MTAYRPSVSASAMNWNMVMKVLVPRVSADKPGLEDGG